MLLVTLALKTVLSISQNGINQIALNKHLGNHLNMDITNASTNGFDNCYLTCKISDWPEKTCQALAYLTASVSDEEREFSSVDTSLCSSSRVTDRRSLSVESTTRMTN